MLGGAALAAVVHVGWFVRDHLVDGETAGSGFQRQQSQLVMKMDVRDDRHFGNPLANFFEGDRGIVVWHGQPHDPQEEVRVARITAFVVGAVSIAGVT